MDAASMLANDEVKLSAPAELNDILPDDSVRVPDERNSSPEVADR
jgi:hypothetical protein